jgi:hypothetical protein
MPNRLPTCLRISSMAENKMAAPYANTKYSRKSGHGDGDRVSRKFRWGQEDPVTGPCVTKGSNYLVMLKTSSRNVHKTPIMQKKLRAFLLVNTHPVLDRRHGGTIVCSPCQSKRRHQFINHNY